ncbi:hypothetical protein ACFFLM_04980 [Deinococcus oregonensis]|uniref:Uncharacterized protein n=1 Tax=Deinococcus oregonensis TaxID=1805970 RepID=A0ABV6AV01_9DEIO
MTWDDFTATEKKWLFSSTALAFGILLLGWLPFTEVYRPLFQLVGLSVLTAGWGYFTFLLRKNRRIPRLFFWQSCLACPVFVWLLIQEAQKVF